MRDLSRSSGRGVGPVGTKGAPANRRTPASRPCPTPPPAGRDLRSERTCWTVLDSAFRLAAPSRTHSCGSGRRRGRGRVRRRPERAGPRRVPRACRRRAAPPAAASGGVNRAVPRRDARPHGCRPRHGGGAEARPVGTIATKPAANARCARRLEDPEPQSPEQADEREVEGVVGASNCRCVSPSRRTASVQPRDRTAANSGERLQAPDLRKQTRAHCRGPPAPDYGSRG
jgi:hypothetical protein